MLHPSSNCFSLLFEKNGIWSLRETATAAQQRIATLKFDVEIVITYLAPIISIMLWIYGPFSDNWVSRIYGFHLSSIYIIYVPGDTILLSWDFAIANDVSNSTPFIELDSDSAFAIENIEDAFWVT